MWGYISLGYFRQRPVAGEVGSRRAAQGQSHRLRERRRQSRPVERPAALPGRQASVSRWQRDLTDSTVLRNVASPSAMPYFLALDRARPERVEVDPRQTRGRPRRNWELLAEPIQTVMRRVGVENAYESNEVLTRGQRVDADSLDASSPPCDPRGGPARAPGAFAAALYGPARRTGAKKFETKKFLISVTKL